MGEEYLTIEQVEAKYPNEWVVLNVRRKGRDGFAIDGVVIAHGSDKENVYLVADTVPPPRSLKFWFTGRIPEDVVFLL